MANLSQQPALEISCLCLIGEPLSPPVVCLGPLDIGCFQTLGSLRYGKESVVLSSGPVTLFSTKGFPPTLKSLTSLDEAAVPFGTLHLMLSLFS